MQVMVHFRSNPKCSDGIFRLSEPIFLFYSTYTWKQANFRLTYPFRFNSLAKWRALCATLVEIR